MTNHVTTMVLVFKSAFICCRIRIKNIDDDFIIFMLIIPCILTNYSSIVPIELSLIVLGAVQQPSMLGVPLKECMTLSF